MWQIVKKKEKDTRARGPCQVRKTYIFYFEFYKKDNIVTVYWVSLCCFCSRRKSHHCVWQVGINGCFYVLWNLTFTCTCLFIYWCCEYSVEIICSDSSWPKQSPHLEEDSWYRCTFVSNLLFLAEWCDRDFNDSTELYIHTHTQSFHFVAREKKKHLKRCQITGSE